MSKCQLTEKQWADLMKSSHARGPWRIEDGMILDGSDMLVANLPPCVTAEDKATANLLAAAPTLLHALKMCLASGELTYGRAEAAHDAIRLAEVGVPDWRKVRP